MCLPSHRINLHPVKLLIAVSAAMASFAAMAPFGRSLIAAQDDIASVRIEVQVPEATPVDSQVYIAGNMAELGAWKPDHRSLQRREDGIFQIELRLPIGKEIEFKFTRGSWRNVEKDDLGKEIANRRIEVRSDLVFRCEVQSWADSQIVPASTATGNMKVLEVDSPFLKSPRRVTVWLPPDYEKRVDQRSGVLYMLDGQNVFDRSHAAFGVEWQADETMQQMIDGAKIKPWMIVAIDNSEHRVEEYTPTAMNGRGGEAERFMKFLKETLKPLIDAQFRTIPDAEYTVIAGSSLGGLFALYAVTQHADCFGGAIAMSPSLFWDDEQLLRTIEHEASRDLEDIDANADPPDRMERIWIDTGDFEGGSEAQQRSNVDRIQRLHQALIKLGFPDDVQVKLMIDVGARHNESAWAGRLPRALEFMLGER